jgi:hypothetical protein
METTKGTKEYFELKLISFKDKTRNLISTNQDTMEAKMAATRLEFQSQMEEVIARACANAASRQSSKELHRRPCSGVRWKL